MFEIPFYALLALLDEHTDVMREYQRISRSAMQSRSSKGRTVLAICYPGLIEHGA